MTHLEGIPETDYLFRAYNGNKYVVRFEQNKTIEDAINYFESNEFNFKDVKIYPIEDQTPKYNVDISKCLNSFSTRRFLLCARYSRNSKLYVIKSNDIKEGRFMETPDPSKYSQQYKRESILLIQQASNLLVDNPNFEKIFNEICNFAKCNKEHFYILNDDKNREKIKELLKQKKMISNNVS